LILEDALFPYQEKRSQAQNAVGPSQPLQGQLTIATNGIDSGDEFA